MESFLSGPHLCIENILFWVLDFNLNLNWNWNLTSIVKCRFLIYHDSSLLFVEDGGEVA